MYIELINLNSIESLGAYRTIVCLSFSFNSSFIFNEYENICILRVEFRKANYEIQTNQNIMYMRELMDQGAFI